MRVFFVGVLALLLIGCATPKPIHFYDLENGTRLTGQIDDFSNEVSVTLHDGETLHGEFQQFPGGHVVSGFTQTDFSGSTDMGMNEFSGQSQSTSSGYAMSTQHKGHAILHGQDGYIMELMFTFNPFVDHGYGVARDSEGNKYRVKF
jgi:hypothetical protein